MKIAVLIAGEYREFPSAHKFWTFLQWPNVDCYFATWDKSLFIPHDTKIPPTVETITDASIINYIDVKNFDIAPTIEVRGYSSPKMINRWQAGIRMMVDSGVTYDRVILIRPDIALEYEDNVLKDYITSSISENNALYGIISYPLDKPFPLETVKKVSDLILVGTPQVITKLLNLSTPVHHDSHKYLADNFISMGINWLNLPIAKHCIVRPNCRGLNLDFDEIKINAKEWWEYKNKGFYDMAENVFNPKPNKVELPYYTRNCVNLWDKQDYCTWYERNKTFQWFSADLEDRYDRNVIDPKFKNHKTYSKTDITYTYNSLGFRIAGAGPKEFAEGDGYPKVLVGGCSVTEGIGLPEEHIWHSFLINKLSKHSVKPIAKFNVGKGGRSITAAIRYAYASIEHYKFKPDVVFLCLPPVTRNEFLIHSDNEDPMIYHYIPGCDLPYDASALLKQTHKNVMEIINYRQYYHECFKTLLLFKWMCEAKNIPWYFNFWNNDFTSYLIKESLKDNLVDCSLPKELTNHFIPTAFKPAKKFPFEYTIARDYMHFGPNDHYNMAENIYEHLLTTGNLNNIYLNWKT